MLRGTKRWTTSPRTLMRVAVSVTPYVCASSPSSPVALVRGGAGRRVTVDDEVWGSESGQVADWRDRLRALTGDRELDTGAGAMDA